MKSIGVIPKSIRTTQVGNTWRVRGKELLVAKKIEISLTDFNTINKIITPINHKGIESMYIDKLKNKNLQKHLKEAKNKLY